jgi:hypothetical protein
MVPGDPDVLARIDDHGDLVIGEVTPYAPE